MFHSIRSWPGRRHSNREQWKTLANGRKQNSVLLYFLYFKSYFEMFYILTENCIAVYLPFSAFMCEYYFKLIDQTLFI